MQQTISVYLIAYALMSVVHAPLSAAIGRRKVIIGGFAVFTLASVGCALASDLPRLLAFSALKALSAGVGLFVGRALCCAVVHGAARPRLMGTVQSSCGRGAGNGPSEGGRGRGW